MSSTAFSSFFTRILSGLFMLAFLGIAFATCNKTDVQKADLRWAQAIDSNNVNKVVDLYAPQAVLVATLANHPITTRVGRVDYFKKFFNTYKGARVSYTGAKYIQIFKGGAVSSGLYVFSGKKQGKKTNVPARYTFVYRDSTNGCQLITQHSSSLPE